MAELNTAEKAAYDVSFNRTKKQAARDKGAADAGGDPILEAARQRALAPQPESGAPNPPVGRVQPTKPSGEFIERPDGSRVPREYYSLTPDQQDRFDQLLKEEKTGAKEESLALQYTLMIGDQLEQQAGRITELESQLFDALDAVYVVQRRMEAIDTSAEVSKSDELIKAQSDIAQQVTNLAAVKAEAESSATSIRRETEIQISDHQNRMAAIEQPIAELEGRVRSTTLLMGERSNAAISKLDAMEPKVQGLDVQLIELANRSDALGNPITRSEMRADITTVVTEELKAQSPEMVNQAITVIKEDEFGGKTIFGQRVDGDLTRQRRSDADAMANIR